MTSFQRRTTLALCACALLGSLAVHAQTTAPAVWPTKPVRFWVPVPAGTAPDIVARVMGDKLSKAWGQPVIIENRPGAGGLIGLGAIKSGTQDGHTFALVPASILTLTPTMFKSTQVDVVRDFVPVALVAEGPLMMAVNASSPVNSLAELLALARKNPDAFVVTSPLIYSLPYLAGELLARVAGVPLRAVPYTSSGAAIAAVMNNDAQVIIDGIPPIDSMVKGGKLKAIAFFSDGRMPGRPHVAAVNETYPGMVVNGWFGIVAPKGTSDKAIERVNLDVAKLVHEPEMSERFDSLGVHAKSMTPAQFGKYWTDDRLRWEKLMLEIGVKPQ